MITNKDVLFGCPKINPIEPGEAAGLPVVHIPSPSGSTYMSRFIYLLQEQVERKLPFSVYTEHKHTRFGSVDGYLSNERLTAYILKIINNHVKSADLLMITSQPSKSGLSKEVERPGSYGVVGRACLMIIGLEQAGRLLKELQIVSAVNLGWEYFVSAYVRKSFNLLVYHYLWVATESRGSISCTRDMWMGQDATGHRKLKQLTDTLDVLFPKSREAWMCRNLIEGRGGRVFKERR